MTSTEIWKQLNQITPKKPVYRLACSMASLDTQTVLDLIEKYKTDQSMTEIEINKEIRKQKNKENLQWTLT